LLNDIPQLIKKFDHLPSRVAIVLTSKRVKMTSSIQEGTARTTIVRGANADWWHFYNFIILHGFSYFLQETLSFNFIYVSRLITT
jgi:hypothetical protein|tara:strand:- start:8802 stop:9056 length:255 start_codon:yes stop_codon:yes gene_type:complete